MNTKYINLVDQTFGFLQEEFKIADNKLNWHGIHLIALTVTCGTPLKFIYSQKISKNFNKVKGWFQNSIQKHSHKGAY